MRSTISNCSLTVQPDALAIIYYPSAPTDAKPDTTAWTDTTDQCANDPLSSTTPTYSITPTPDPVTTITLSVGAIVNSTGHFLWIVNNISFRADYNAPILLLANVGNTSYPYDPEWNVYNTGNVTSVRLIVQNETPAAHPMHLHGHNMYVLNEGVGSWDGTIVDSGNPQRRDVQLMPPDGYIVVQYDSVNPGVWPFHCHIAWHVSGGLYISLLVSFSKHCFRSTGGRGGQELVLGRGRAGGKCKWLMKFSRNNRPISQRCNFRDRASRLVSIGLLLLMLMLWMRSIRVYRALRCRELRYVIGQSSGERLRDCGLYGLLYQFVMR